MYVCIEVAWASNWAWGRGPSSWSNVPILQVPSLPRHAHWLILAHYVTNFCPKNNANSVGDIGARQAEKRIWNWAWQEIWITKGLGPFYITGPGIL